MRQEDFENSYDDYGDTPYFLNDNANHHAKRKEIDTRAKERIDKSEGMEQDPHFIGMKDDDEELHEEEDKLSLEKYREKFHGKDNVGQEEQEVESEIALYEDHEPRLELQGNDIYSNRRSDFYGRVNRRQYYG